MTIQLLEHKCGYHGTIIAKYRFDSIEEYEAFTELLSKIDVALLEMTK